MNKLALTITTLSLAVFSVSAPAANEKSAEKKMTDGEIAQTLITINEGEIDAGKYAERHAQKPEVKEYAKMMVDEHQANVKATKAMAKKEGISPKKNDDAKDIMADAKKSNEDLKKADKASLDKTYLNEQVKMHESALSKLKDDLIPNSTNTSLKEHLQKTSEAVAKHLEHAKALVEKM